MQGIIGKNCGHGVGSNGEIQGKEGAVAMGLEHDGILESLFSLDARLASLHCF